MYIADFFCVCVGGGGGGGGGVKILNFNIFLVLGKNDYFWGLEIFVDIFWGSLLILTIFICYIFK